MNPINLKRLSIWAVICLLLISLPVLAEEEEKKDEEEKPKTIAELTEKSERIDGLFTLYRDNKSGQMHMAISADQLDTEYVHFAQAANGVVDAGYFRGAYLANGVLMFKRHYDRIEVIARNTSFYFDPDNALARAADANVPDAVLAVEKILAEDEESGEVLIKADSLFLTENLMQVKPSPNPDADPKTTFTLGSLSEDKSKILNVRSYPLNSDVEVEYVYNNPAPTVYGEAAVTDARNVSIRVLHSLIAMPEDDYQPRQDDPRVGYFGTETTDLTSFSATPYRDFIARWKLVKKDPDAALSEPVEPITWWIENTTPVEYRDLIRSAALEWNSSFEKAGFRNAVVVKVQPDDAEWDAGDIRYNVLRWTSSPNPPFGGYGPSFVNPRTGQIMGADVMLEFSFMNRYLYAEHLLSEPAAFNLMGQQAGHFCNVSEGLKSGQMMARVAAEAAGYGEGLTEQLIHDTMHYLILHEIGHTLGLNHNMKATQLLSPTEAFDPAIVDERGLAGSVMDYPAVNFAPRGATQTRFYAVKPGPYDDWAIEFGYTPSLTDAQAEAQRVNALLSRSTEPELAFGNDADDMRSPGKAIDPRVNIYDMSSDPIEYAAARMTLLSETINGLGERLPAAGKSYQETHDAYVVLMREWGRSANVVSRFVGGVYLDRAMSGQAGGGQPYTPVPADVQAKAIDVLGQHLFAPTAFDAPADLYRYLARQRRGFNFYSETEDPKVHQAVLAMQQAVLDHVLHPSVLKRMTDSSLYGNEYSLGEMMGDLTDAVFDADMRGDVNSFRQNLQVEYVNRLVAMVSADSKAQYDYMTQSMALHVLAQLEDQLKRRRGADLSTQAHVNHLKLTIARALDPGASS
ncbi:MAG: hypothetical protein DHS20C11_33480 [Lysobacteraceae bacterium]|nr:MAG: hypothetical protein DHS20C11_33480 [Xanthomonadaceae bacterium]